MNTDHTVHIYCLEGLAVVVDEGKTNDAEEERKPSADDALTGRGDELDDVQKLQKVAEALETKHLDEQASIVKDHVRAIVAKQLNEFDGFDR